MRPTMAHDHAHRPIDLHAHYLSPPVLKILEACAPEYGIEWKVIEGKGPQFRTGHLVTGPVGKRFADLDTRLEEMDKQGVEAHALSMSQPMCYWAKPALAQEICEVYNDSLADAHV